MFDTQLLLIILGVFLFAGCIKGLVGMGLPMISVALLANVIGLQASIALIVVPALLTNIWQALAGSNTRQLFRRFWTLFLATILFTWPGTVALAHVETAYLTGLLGILLIAYTILNFFKPGFNVPAHWERRLNPLIGAISGVLSGLTGFFAVPGVVYLQSTQLSRDDLIQTLGMVFCFASVGLSVSLGTQSLLTPELALYSTLAMVPTVCGVWIGNRLRKRTSERAFRRLFLIALGLLGLYTIAGSISALS